MIPALAGFALLACSAPQSQDTLVVFAASSLTEAFGDLETVFERANDGADVQINYAGSQVLRLQIEQGASADLVASANPDHLDALASLDLVERPIDFATNDLVVVVPRDNPARIERFADLDRAERLVVGHPNVPIGSYTELLLSRAGSTLGEAFEARVRAHVVSRESNVRLVRAKVVLGEADAAIVYRTDRSEKLRVIEVPTKLGVQARYPIAQTTHAANPALATSFLAFVGSDQGRSILQRHGFRTPKAPPGRD